MVENVTEGNEMCLPSIEHGVADWVSASVVYKWRGEVPAGATSLA